MTTNDKDTRVRIGSKAHDLIMKYGIRSVSMDDIANALGISKKTIYQYYADKDELIDGIVETILTDNQHRCVQYRTNSRDAVDEVMRAKELLRDMFTDMNPSVLFDLQKYHHKAFTRFLRHKNDFLFSMIKNNIERGISEELYRPDLNIDVITRFRVESMMMPFNPGIFFTFLFVF